MKKYHFISGLPRSGSTLLSSILKQNPDFHASISDPLATLVKGVLETSQSGPGMKAEVPEQRRKNLLHSLFDGYYKDVDANVCFNTNRAWTIITPLLKELYPEAKMICCVRDIHWILDSFEKAAREHPLQASTVFEGTNNTNVYTRMDSLMNSGGIVEFAYTALKQAITSNEKNMLMLVEYEQLCKNPDGILKAIYNFIDEPYYKHDFDNVEGAWDEYDYEIGLPLHKVKRKVEWKQRNTILPPDIINKYTNMEVWRM